LVQTFFERSFAINRLRQGPLAEHIDLLAARLATHGYSRVHSPEASSCLSPPSTSSSPGTAVRIPSDLEILGPRGLPSGDRSRKTAHCRAKSPTPEVAYSEVGQKRRSKGVRGHCALLHIIGGYPPALNRRAGLRSVGAHTDRALPRQD
jgi:hypothetical protein